jgi:hypothetical protein
MRRCDGLHRYSVHRGNYRGSKLRADKGRYPAKRNLRFLNGNKKTLMPRAGAVLL